MRLINYLRLRREGFTDKAATALCSFEEPELGAQDDIAVGWIIAAIFVAYIAVQIIDAAF